MDKVLKVIETIADNIPARIQCYSFHLILKSIFEDAVPYYNNSHVITKIGNKYYDIDGEVSVIDSYSLLDDYGDNWKRNLIEAKETFYRWQIEEAFENKKYVYR